MFRTLVTDQAGRGLTELEGAQPKGLNVPLSGFATANAAVRLDRVDSDYLLGCDTLLKVVEDVEEGPYAGVRVLHFHGRQITAEETASGGATGSVAATWADPFWTVMHRVIQASMAATGWTRGTALAPVDPAVIVAEVVTGLNAVAATGLAMGDTAASSPTYVGPLFYKKAGELVAELGAVLGGPEFRVRPVDLTPPVEPAALGVFGLLDVKDAIGQAAAGAVFEYGEGGNVASYSRTLSLDTSANVIYALPPGFPDNATAGVLGGLNAFNAPAVAKHGVLEDVLTSDLVVDDLRLRLAQLHAATRGGPRQQITFTPAKDLGTLPRFGLDYSVGDAIRFRAAIVRAGTVYRRINALFRLYGWGVNIDPTGAGDVSLTVTPTG